MNIFSAAKFAIKYANPTGSEATAAISPIAAKNVETYQNIGRIDPNGISQIVVLATTGGTILGQVNARKSGYTPKRLLEANKPEKQ